GDNNNDLNLSRLYNTPGYDNQARNNAFRSLMSQLGMALAPQFHAPAETTGYGGFAFSAKYAATTIDNKADYWVNGLNVAPDPILNTLSLEVRKGIWLPIPSFELGAGFTHLVDSHMFVLNVFAKLALHEGFLHWPTPAIAARFSGQRVVGTDQVDLTVLSFDLSISKSFGVGGVINFTPYLGYNVLWVIADSQVIDTTPGTDSLQCSVDPSCSHTIPIPPGQFCTDADCGRNYVFDDQDAILRHRVFLGLRMIVYRFVLTMEAAWALQGNSADSLAFSGLTIKDRAKLQQTYSVSIGWDY
ncbi:MAG: hypothetical protein RBU30_13575, partial [Polyangia bacterium]|nr:hypothetical protein [Polyangia bacterium]